MKNYFITGTDTNVGKTITAAVLNLALNSAYWKPIQSGINEDISDRDRIQQLTGLTDTHFYPTTYSLQASLSPNQAAKLENIVIDLNQCIVPQTNQHLIIEGAGGVFVPLNNEACILDLIEQFAVPVIVVARGTLGTINHTLLTLQALRQRGLTPFGVVYCGHLLEENRLNIEKWGNIRTLLHIPHFEDLNPATLQQWTMANKARIEAAFL